MLAARMGTPGATLRRAGHTAGSHKDVCRVSVLLRHGPAAGRWAGRHLPLLPAPPPPLRKVPTCAASSAADSSPLSSQAQLADDMQMWMDRLERMHATPRSVAVMQLLRIEQEGAYAGLVGGSPGAVDAGDDGEDEGRGGGSGAWHKSLDARDARMVTEVVQGVTRWRRRLDFTLGRLTRKDVAALDPPLRQILRCGLYELAEMKAPGHVINEHVELAKRVMHQGAASFANGVLRNAVRQLQSGELLQPPAPTRGMPPDQVAEALAVGASHPTWLVQQWLAQYGPADTMALLKHNNARPCHALRLAPGQDPADVCRMLVQRGAEVQPSRYLPREFVTVSSGMQAVLSSGVVRRGEAQVQDEAAGLVVAMLDPRPGESLLDACAAPGGKTLFAAARMQGRGSITALDISVARLAALRDAARRQRVGGMVRTVAADLRAFAARQEQQAAAAAQHHQQEEHGEGEAGPAGADQPSSASSSSGAGGTARQAWQYDRVLLDAPCSGTGVLAKRADMRWRRGPAELRQLAELQGGLLDAAAPLVAPGGLLVYSTCSIEAAENQQQVAAFLQQHPEFSVEPPPSSTGVPPECISAEGFLRMLPHVHGTDGAFAVRLRRAA